MDGNTLNTHVVTKRIKPDGSGVTVAAGATDVVSDIIDTAGYEGVRIVTGFGAIVAGAATSQKVEEGAAANMSDTADLAGSSVTISDADDGKISLIDVYRPAKRYLTVTTKRATQNATIDFMLVELYGERKLPVTQDATVVAAGAKSLYSPLEGTA